MGIGMVLAVGVYYVSTINLTVDVKEPFTVEYAILGDAGNYNGELCSGILDDASWTPLNGGVIDKDGFYPMESRKICVKITNAGQAAIPYVITSSITNDNANYDCLKAFGTDWIMPSSSGNVPATGSYIDGVVVTIPADAPVVTDCNVQIKVGRGTVTA
ncbi:MAG: hypothetical protein IMZ60_02570 [Actinobacteria bacterium]|nr:hypothetical protein [Actinomycetota bacterium]